MIILNLLSPFFAGLILAFSFGAAGSEIWSERFKLSSTLFMYLIKHTAGFLPHSLKTRTVPFFLVSLGFVFAASGSKRKQSHLFSNENCKPSKAAFYVTHFNITFQYSRSLMDCQNRNFGFWKTGNSVHCSVVRNLCCIKLKLVAQFEELSKHAMLCLIKYLGHIISQVLVLSSVT